MKQKTLGYIDLCDNEIKTRISAQINFKDRAFIELQTKEVAKKTAKEWTKTMDVKYSVYEVIIRKLK